MLLTTTCQHCQESFEYDAADELTACPHCGLWRPFKITLPTTPPVYPPLSTKNPQLKTLSKIDNALALIGWLLALPIPILAGCLGIYLLCKKQFTQGLGILALSCAAIILWTIIILKTGIGLPQ